ncbi:MAG TPA: N-acetylmuramoyl-L-alanine amidase [Acidimicrobiales bacterium]|nr:N-acetylmuramoyl-L-alanine amidase [Acidimicrobiales bacterium]
MLTRRCLAAATLVLTLAAWLPWVVSPGVAGSAPAYPPNSVVPFGTTSVGANAVSNPNAPVVGLAATHDGGGYWLVGSDGGIFSYGDARFFGSTGALRLNAPIVGMAAAPDGGGYWLVARDGGVFNYGDAGFFGSAGALHLNAPIVGMAATGDGMGYWLVGTDGGIFSYGDARFWGSTGATHLNAPVVGMAATPSGGGYWLVASDGGIFSYGSATYFGSLGGAALPSAVVGMAATPSGGGYWLVLGSGALAGKVVGIDPGHNGQNGNDPGFIDQPVYNGTGEEPCDTVGTETATGYTEAEFNFDVATDLQADLQAEGATVVMTRTDNDGVGPCVTTRAAIVNDAAPNVAVDIHADGGPPGGSGFTVLEPVADGPNNGVIASSDAFGAVLRDAFTAGTGMPVADYGGSVDGLVARDDLAGLNLTTVPKALIEIGNMQNAGDAGLQVSASFQQAAAQAIAKAITEFLNAPA